MATLTLPMGYAPALDVNPIQCFTPKVSAATTCWLFCFVTFASAFFIGLGACVSLALPIAPSPSQRAALRQAAQCAPNMPAELSGLTWKPTDPLKPSRAVHGLIESGGIPDSERI